MARLDPARALILGDRVPRASTGIVAWGQKRGFWICLHIDKK